MLMLPPGKVTKRTLAVLGALCFFLSALEYMIPKPLPFLRIGLANLPLLLALDIMPFPSFLFLIGLKIIGQALISGTLFSYVFLFSLGGTGVSALLMYALRRVPGKKMMSLVGVSAAGALAFNGAQLVLSYFFIFGDSIRYAAAPVLAMGIVTGTLLGIASEYFIKQSKWYKQIEGPLNDQSTRISTTNHTNTTNTFSNVIPRKFFGPGELAIAGLCMIPALLFNPDTQTRIIQFLFFLILAWSSGKKINLLLTFFIMITIIFFNLLVPYGEILYSLGPLAITYGALMGGIRRAVTLEALIMLSRFCVSKDLPSVFKKGYFGEVLGESFSIFSDLAEEKHLFNIKNWIKRIDELLITGGESSFTLDNGKRTEAEHTALPRSCKRMIGSRLILAVLVFLAWLPLIPSFVIFITGAIL